MHCASVESYLVQVLQTLEYKCASAGTSRNEGQFLARLARLSTLFPPLGKATAVLFAFLHKNAVRLQEPGNRCEGIQSWESGLSHNI